MPRAAMPLTTEERNQIDEGFARLDRRISGLEEESGLASSLMGRLQDVERDGRNAVGLLGRT